MEALELWEIVLLRSVDRLEEDGGSLTDPMSKVLYGQIARCWSEGHRCRGCGVRFSAPANVIERLTAFEETSRRQKRELAVRDTFTRGLFVIILSYIQ